MKSTLLTIITFALIFILSSCFPEGFKEQANQQFGDQHFKTAIALIELHHVREGKYPAKLDSLKFVGEWDKMIFHSVSYKRLDDGYELNLDNGWIGKPQELKYPENFWNGLGLRKSNLKAD